MNREDILRYLSSPDTLDEKSGHAIKETIGKFPYYSLLYLLLARSYKNEANPGLQDVIEKAAAYASDREGLYLFLHAQGEPVPANPLATGTPEAAEAPEASRQAVIGDVIPEPGEASESGEAREPDEALEPEAALEPGEAPEAGEARGPGKAPEAEEDPDPAEVPPAADAPEAAEMPARKVGTSLEKRPAGRQDIALNIDDQVPRTFTVWLRRVRQVTEKESDNSLKATDPLEKNYYRELITRNTEKEYLSQSGVEFDLEKREDRIIAKFIEEDPQVIKSALTIEARDQPADAASGSEGDEVISETLAKIYIDQNLTDKAIRMYEKLSLKFPEKSAYFAGLIAKLKK